MSNLYYIGDDKPADSLNELIQYMEEQYDPNVSALIGQTVSVYKSTEISVEGIVNAMNIGDEITDRLFNWVGEENYDEITRLLKQPELDINKAITEAVNKILNRTMLPNELIKEFKITAEHIRKYHAWEGQDD